MKKKIFLFDLEGYEMALYIHLGCFLALLYTVVELYSFRYCLTSTDAIFFGTVPLLSLVVAILVCLSTPFSLTI